MKPRRKPTPTGHGDTAYRGYLIRWSFGRSGYYIEKGGHGIQAYTPTVAEAMRIIDTLLD